MNLPHQMNFFAIAIPGVIAALAIFLVNLKTSVDGQALATPDVKPNPLAKEATH
jgi:AAHS family benzoate transporter-like MFS transporter